MKHSGTSNSGVSPPERRPEAGGEGRSCHWNQRHTHGSEGRVTATVQTAGQAEEAQREIPTISPPAQPEARAQGPGKVGVQGSASQAAEQGREGWRAATVGMVQWKISSPAGVLVCF